MDAPFDFTVVSMNSILITMVKICALILDLAQEGATQAGNRDGKGKSAPNFPHP